MIFKIMLKNRIKIVMFQFNFKVKKLLKIKSLLRYKNFLKVNLLL